jgi:hypothetical protein
MMRYPVFNKRTNLISVENFELAHFIKLSFLRKKIKKIIPDSTIWLFDTMYALNVNMERHNPSGRIEE